MIDFLEIDEKKKKIKTLDLNDLSVEELNLYLEDLKKEIERVKKEVENKRNTRKEAEKFFK